MEYFVQMNCNTIIQHMPAFCLPVQEKLVISFRFSNSYLNKLNCSKVFSFSPSPVQGLCMISYQFKLHGISFLQIHN